MRPGEPPKTGPASIENDEFCRVRDGIEDHCRRFGECDYDSVNAVVTLKRTSIDFENFIAAYFKQYDLSPGRFNVLMTLFTADNHTQSLSDLGDRLIVSRANITGLVDGLVEDGMLKRLDHPDDRRVVLAQLTDKALKFLNWFAPVHHKNIKLLMEMFSTDEKRQFVALCDKLRAQMRRIGPLTAVEPSSSGTAAK
jgi:MarR family transcriptional regulator, 2-MHQ and catechol-resistance regulon repressor